MGIRHRCLVGHEHPSALVGLVQASVGVMRCHAILRRRAPRWRVHVDDAMREFARACSLPLAPMEGFAYTTGYVYQVDPRSGTGIIWSLGNLVTWSTGHLATQPMILRKCTDG